MDLPNGLRLEIDANPTSTDIDYVADQLEHFNEATWPGHQPWNAIGIFVRTQGTITAGLLGETYAGWLFVRYLWVSGTLRGQGVGRALLTTGEQQALERGCHSVWLDTFSFQAPGFYKTLGYQVFGELDWSPGHKRLFLRKQLQPVSPP